MAGGGGVFVLAGHSLAFILVFTGGCPLGLASSSDKQTPGRMPDPLGALVSSKGSTGSPKTPFVGPRVSSKVPGSGPSNESCSGKLFPFLPPSLLDRGCLSSTHLSPDLWVSLTIESQQTLAQTTSLQSFLWPGTHSSWAVGEVDS